MASSRRLVGCFSAFVLSLGVVACGSQTESSPPVGDWVLQTIVTPNGETQPGVEITLGFDQAGNVSGSSGCNRYSGTVGFEGPGLTFSPFASTRMACPEEQMLQETDYLNALEAVRVWVVSGGELVLESADAHFRLQYARAPAS